MTALVLGILWVAFGLAVMIAALCSIKGRS